MSPKAFSRTYLLFLVRISWHDDLVESRQSKLGSHIGFLFLRNLRAGFFNKFFDPVYPKHVLGFSMFSKVEVCKHFVLLVTGL